VKIVIAGRPAAHWFRRSRAATLRADGAEVAFIGPGATSRMCRPPATELHAIAVEGLRSLKTPARAARVLRAEARVPRARALPQAAGDRRRDGGGGLRRRPVELAALVAGGTV